MARFHYCAGAPATVDLVLRARVVGLSEIAGVLVVSRAVLNGAWREIAWPGRFMHADSARAAREVNASLRCISRVIVEPRFRGMSIARRLVEAYLNDPQSPATESIAAMGAFCPFFQRAGMSAIEAGPARRDRRLLAVLHERGLRVRDLLEIDWEEEAGELRRALGVWARGSRSTRAMGEARAGELAWLAARRLIRPRRVFVHGRGDWAVRGGDVLESEGRGDG